MADTGDSRLAAPIWVGRYELEKADGVMLDNAGVMLSKQQIVQLLGNASQVTAGSVFATLPSECRPDSEVMLPVVVTGTASSVAVLTMSPTGEMRCSAGGTVHLNGISFHICSNYY